MRSNSQHFNLRIFFAKKDRIGKIAEQHAANIGFGIDGEAFGTAAGILHRLGEGIDIAFAKARRLLLVPGNLKQMLAGGFGMEEIRHSNSLTEN